MKLFIITLFSDLDLSLTLQVSGTFTATPFSLRNGSIQVYQSGFSVAVSTDFGLVVTYDAYSYVTISVPYDYQNGTCGLCGNFNYRPEDDYRTPSGEILSSDLDFGNSWKTTSDTDPGCENTHCSGLTCAACTTNQNSLYSSSDYCGIMGDPSGPFASCHSRLDPQTFIESCVYDLCVGGGYQPILCRALNVYAAQCQQQGIQLGQWRRQGFCGRHHKYFIFIIQLILKSIYILNSTNSIFLFTSYFQKSNAQSTVTSSPRAQAVQQPAVILLHLQTAPCQARKAVFVIQDMS